MSAFTTILLTIVTTVLINNVVLSQFMGLCPFLGVSKQIKTALGMGAAVIFVITVSSAVTACLYRFVLLRFDLVYLNTILFIVVIAALVQFVEMALKKFIPSLHKALGVYLPLITTNCAVLGVCISNIDDGYTYLQSLVNSLGAGIGFLLAMVIFSGMRRKIEDNTDVPRAFQGVPITMTAAALLSLAFMGFGGLV